MKIDEETKLGNYRVIIVNRGTRDTLCNVWFALKLAGCLLVGKVIGFTLRNCIVTEYQDIDK